MKGDSPLIPGMVPLKPLMICYYYPPLTDVGGKRSVAFARYFTKYGWRPSVLSVKNPDKVFCRPGDITPPEDIPVSYSYSIINLSYLFGKANGFLSKFLKIIGIQVQGNRFHDFFSVPDRFWGWIPLTTLKAVRLVRKNNHDFIYVSCTPYSSAIIGIFVKSFTRKPLVIDFRDPFALKDLDILYSSRFKAKLNKFIEKIILKHADLFLVTSAETHGKYIEQYPFISGKIFTIYNGFETSFLLPETKGKFEKFTIVYTGDFYFWAPQDNELFFKALAKLKTEGKINRENFQFLFYGDAFDEITALAKKYSIADIVLYKERVPYQEVLTILSRSHLQLLRIVKPMISTKFFEGIPLNIPFLATIPSGEVEEFVRKYSPSSSIITDGSVDKVAEAIQKSIVKYKNSEMKDNLIDDFLDIFSRENQTKKLMTIIREQFIH